MTMPERRSERAFVDPWAPRDMRVTTILLLGRLLGARRDVLCRIRNISSGGMMVEAPGAFAIGDLVKIEPKVGQHLQGRVRWAEPGRMGVAFAQPIDVGEFLAQTSLPGTGGEEVRSPRFDTDCGAELRVRGQVLPARLVNLSLGGAGLRGCGELAQGELLALTIPGLPDREAAVRWTGGGVTGVALLEKLCFADLSLWLADDATRFQPPMAKGPGR